MKKNQKKSHHSNSPISTFLRAIALMAILLYSFTHTQNDINHPFTTSATEQSRSVDPKPSTKKPKKKNSLKHQPSHLSPLSSLDLHVETTARSRHFIPLHATPHSSRIIHFISSPKSRGQTKKSLHPNLPSSPSSYPEMTDRSFLNH